MNLQIINPTFKDGSTLPYLGKKYPLKILKREAKNGIRFAHGQFIITLLSSRRNSSADHLVIERLYEHWLTKTARSIFKNEVESYSEKLGISKPEKIVIKKMKNRWGSIGIRRDTINLNVNLVKAPEDIIDYIILHELCHLKINEHSHHFWDLLHKSMPNYQKKIDWLNRNGTSHNLTVR